MTTATATGVGRSSGGEARTDEDRMADLVATHEAALLTYATHLTAGDRMWAEDVVQETWVRAWRRIHRMSGEYGSVRSWLMRVTHNLVMDGHRARRARREKLTDDDVRFDAVADHAEQAVAVVMVDRALATLNGRYRTVLEETYLQDRTVVDAAARLGLPVGTVKSRVFYGLRQLRTQLT